jgi:hypothetical protein
MASAVPETDLHTFSTGWPTATSFKRDDNWIFNPVPDNLPIDTIRTDNKRRLAGRPFYYEDITYTDYILEGVPITQYDTLESLPDTYKTKPKARIFAKTYNALATTKVEFQQAVNTFRTKRLKELIAEKKAANQKEWNSMTSGISGQTKAELDGLTQEYLKKKADLEKKLEAAFKAQTKQLVINKQWETQDKYRQYVSSPRLAKPGVKVPDGDKGTVSLSGALDAAGQPIINSIKIPSTRKRHRFRDLIVKPGAAGAAALPGAPAGAAPAGAGAAPAGDPGAAGAAPVPVPPAPNPAPGAPPVAPLQLKKTPLQELIEKADATGKVPRILDGINIYDNLDIAQTVKTNNKRTTTNGASHVDTVDACSKKCSANSTCKAFIFAKEEQGQNCWLLTQPAIVAAAAAERPFVDAPNRATGIKTINDETPVPSPRPASGGKRKTKRKPRRR